VTSEPAADRGHPSPFLSRVVQSLGVLVLRPLVRFLYRCQVHRAGPMPAPPVLLAANHRSFLDPPLVGMWFRHPVSYFARASLWRVPPIRLLLEVMHGIPVERENPGMSSMKGAVENLKRGISVLVFPEGTRTRTGRVGRLREGPALFARRAGVAVVPVYLHRSDEVWPRGSPLPRLAGRPIAVYVGRPMSAPAGMPPRAQDEWLTRRLQAWFLLRERRLLAPRPRGAGAG
jgi:1-acyl-sn-glycerol-3-phosphate acyltransferase